MALLDLYGCDASCVSPWLGCKRHRSVPLAYRSTPTPSGASNVWGMKPA